MAPKKQKPQKSSAELAAQLRLERQRLREQLRAMTHAIALQQKKRQRLMKASRDLSVEDLLQLLRSNSAAEHQDAEHQDAERQDEQADDEQADGPNEQADDEQADGPNEQADGPK